jgi:hypothetical protein
MTRDKKKERETRKRYLAANKEVIRDKSKAYREALPEAEKARRKANRKVYYEANKEAIKAKQRAYGAAHRAALTDLHRRWAAQNKATLKIHGKRYHEKKKQTFYARTYGIDADSIMIKQGNACAICDALLTTANRCGDHCHATGRFRGFLCRRCNSLLGNACDQAKILERALEYLDDPPAWRELTSDQSAVG